MAETTKHSPENKHGHGHDAADDHSGQVSFERGDVNVFQITAFGVGLLLSTIVVMFAMWAMFHFLMGQADKRDAAAPAAMMAEKPSLPPEPRLSGVREKSVGPVLPKVEMDELRADEDAILNNYGWLDPAKGTVRIPITQAIDMVAQKGLPTKTTPSGVDGGFRMIPSDASSGRTLEKISQ